MTEPKPVKAWARVYKRVPHIDVNDIYETEAEAKDFLPRSERVIPVTITPGHEAEDD